MSKQRHFTRRTLIAIGASTCLAGCGNRQASKAQNLPPSGKDDGLGTDPRKWTTGISLPEPVQEIYPCYHQKRIHQAGGFTAQDGRISGPTTDHHSWAPGETQWQAETPLPIARHHPHLISFKERLLAIAGFESPSANAVWNIQSSVWALTPDEQNWSNIAAVPAPAAEAVTAVTGDGNLHLAGGRSWANEGVTGNWQDHTDTDHHFVLTGLDDGWHRAAPCPSKRNSTAGGVINGNLHIIGGRQVGGGNLAGHNVYDHKEDRWRELAPMPQAQGGLAAAVVDGKLYAFGGEFFDNGGGVYPESWVYDPKTDQWAALLDMPSPRHGLGAVELGGKIYVIGGALKASGVETSALVEVFSP